MAARYGVSLMVSSKGRALTLARLVRKDGYGARIEKNTGPSAEEYPYLVRRSDKPLKRRRG